MVVVVVMVVVVLVVVVFEPLRGLLSECFRTSRRLTHIVLALAP